MPTRKVNPTSAGRRNMSSGRFFGHNHRHTPLKDLCSAQSKSHGGRNNQGRLTVRHIGGGHKKAYRVIDFKRDKHDVPGVLSLPYRIRSKP
jgi:large subunit ribosomal protein L2